MRALVIAITLSLGVVAPCAAADPPGKAAPNPQAADTAHAPAQRPGSIAAAQAAVQRAVATVKAEAPAKAQSPAHGAAAGRSQAPPTRARTVARPRAAGPAGTGRPATSGVSLQWEDVPRGARRLSWEADLDPRTAPGGVRLVWSPDTP